MDTQFLFHVSMELTMTTLFFSLLAFLDAEEAQKKINRDIIRQCFPARNSTVQPPQKKNNKRREGRREVFIDAVKEANIN